MKKMTMQACILLLMLLLVACGQQNNSTPVAVDAEMSMRVEPEPMTVGETTLIITLTNSNGTAIDGATLQIHGDMDHEGMTPVDRESRESTGGEYHIPFEWTMGGGWIVTVTAQLPNSRGEITQDFEFFVEAISSDSIINRQSNAEGDSTPEMEMDHSDSDESTPEAAMNMENEDLPITIVYEPDNDPSIGGDATVTIILTDKDHNAITDAIVEIVGNMTHEGMMPISGEGQHDEGGRYIVPLRWTMAGDWQVTVKVTLRDGNMIEKTFNQQVVVLED